MYLIHKTVCVADIISNNCHFAAEICLHDLVTNLQGLNILVSTECP